jgi:ketosteroid isomerase-like protein
MGCILTSPRRALGVDQPTVPGVAAKTRFQGLRMQCTGFTRSVMALVVATAALVPISSQAARADTPDPLVAMFVWWNAAYKQKDGFTAESFSRYFTPDAVMRINGKDRCSGLEDLAQHFRDIQSHTEMVVIDLPFLDEFASPNGDRIFTHHFVRAREHGKDSRERVMGYASIKDGKISLINFVSVPDPSPGSAEKKKE